MTRADDGEAHSRLEVVGDSVMLEPQVVLETTIDARTSAILDRSLCTWWGGGRERRSFRTA